MTNWIKTFDVREIHALFDSDKTPIELGQIYADAIDEFYKEFHHYELPHIAQAFRSITGDKHIHQEAEFEQCQSMLYDWADDNRVWVKSI